jgi:hypothetical protein
MPISNKPGTGNHGATHRTIRRYPFRETDMPLGKAMVQKMKCLDDK